eukprot:1319293-Amorphochlora_amoeboformis.AAC.2
MNFIPRLDQAISKHTLRYPRKSSKLNSRAENLEFMSTCGFGRRDSVDSDLSYNVEVPPELHTFTVKRVRLMLFITYSERSSLAGEICPSHVSSSRLTVRALSSDDTFMSAKEVNIPVKSSIEIAEPLGSIAVAGKNNS